MSQKRINLLMTLAFTLALTGCTGSGESSSRVSIAMPATLTLPSSKGTGSGSGDTLTAKHIVINVSAVGADSKLAIPDFKIWDLCDDCTNPEPIPSSFDFDFKSGDSKLVQALGVYNDDDGKAYFYYGDKSVTLKGGVANVDIELTKKISMNELVSGQITGRFLRPALPAGGPTGRVSVYWTPDSNKPKMLIEQSSMVAGWFSVFGLKGVKFNYQLESTNEEIFDEPRALDSFTPSNQVMVITAPAMRMRNSGSDKTLHAREAKTYVAGYFGNGTALKRVCSMLPANYPTVSGAFATDSMNLITYRSGAAATAVQVNGGMDCSNAQLTNSFSNEFSDYLAFRPSVLSSNSNGDSIGNFESIFWMDAANDIDTRASAFRITRTSAGATFEAKILPGVDAGVIDGLHIYKRIASDNNGSSFRNEVPCDQMSEDKVAGFSSVSFNGLPANLAPLQTISVLLPMVATEVGTAEFAICPYRGKKHLAGLHLRPWMLTGGMNSGGSGPYLQINLGSALSSTGAPNSLAADVCAPMIIGDVSGGTSVRTTSLSINLAASGAVAVYSNATCTNGSNYVEIPADATTATFFIRTNGNGAGQISATVSGNAALTGSYNLTVTSGTPSYIVPQLIGGNSRSSWTSNCGFFDVLSIDPTRNMISTPLGMANFTATVTSGANSIEFRDSCAITGQPAATTAVGFLPTIASSSVLNRIYLRQLDPAAEGEIKFTPGTGASSFAVVNHQLGMNVPMPAAWLKGDAKYFESSGWVSRVQGTRLGTLANLTADSSDPLGYKSVQFNSNSLAKNTDVSQTLLRYGGNISGVIMLKRTGAGRLFSYWNGSSPADGTGPGVSLKFVGDDLKYYVNADAGVNEKISAMNNQYMMVKFRIRRVVTGPTEDQIEVTTNNAAFGPTIHANYFNTVQTPQFLSIGGTGGTDSFSGYIHEVILFNQALDNSQFDSIYSYIKRNYPNVGLPN